MATFLKSSLGCVTSRWPEGCQTIVTTFFKSSPGCVTSSWPEGCQTVQHNHQFPRCPAAPDYDQGTPTGTHKEDLARVTLIRITEMQCPSTLTDDCYDCLLEYTLVRIGNPQGDITLLWLSAAFMSCWVNEHRLGWLLSCSLVEYCVSPWKINALQQWRAYTFTCKDAIGWFLWVGRNLSPSQWYCHFLVAKEGASILHNDTILFTNEGVLVLRNEFELYSLGWASGGFWFYSKAVMYRICVECTLMWHINSIKYQPNFLA